MSRVDSLIAELRARHGNEELFFQRLRPLLEKILDPGTPEESRHSLLELAAETCERQQQVKTNGEAARVALQGYVENLNRTLKRLWGPLGPNHPE